MHKPRRRTKYFERFYFEYEGILYLSKKNCCEKLGFEYGSVLGYRHTNNCSFTEALDHFMEIREQNQFVFRNRNWLNLDNCCVFYGVNKFTVRHYQYDYGDTIQEALEKAIKYTKQIKFVYKGKTYPSLAKCCREMGIPESTVRKCMAETGKTGAVALTHCIKKAEERKYSNPSPFFYREKEYAMFTECCREFNLEPNKVRQKSISLNSSLQDALDFFLLDHPVRRKKNFDDNYSIESVSATCRQYGIKRADIYNYIKDNQCSKEEAIRYYIAVKNKIGTGPITFEGVKYVDVRECCRKLGISYRWVCDRIIYKNAGVDETLFYYKTEKEKWQKTSEEPIYLEDGTKYDNLHDFCRVLKIRQTDIYGYIYRHDCSVQEAADFYASRQTAVDKEMIQIGEMVYTDLQKCCKEQGILYRWVCNKMLRENITASEAVRYYIRKNEKKQLKAQRKAELKEKGKMPEPQRVVVMGQEYESKEKCYKALGITKKLVLRHMRETNCLFEEAAAYCYEKKREKQFEFRGKIYKSYNACCKAYGVAQEYVALKANRERITRQEAIEKLLEQRENKSTLLVDNLITKDEG